MNYDIDVFINIVAIINLIQLALLIPNYKLIFSERTYGGYLDRKKGISFKFESTLVFIAWILLNSLLLIDVIKAYASFAMLIITYYYFILHRFTSISRGMGAPGYFTFYSNKINFLLIFFSEFFPNSIKILIDFISVEIGLIFIVSAAYKIKSGYLTERGINIGLVNPQWSYSPKLWQKIPPSSLNFKILNFLSIYMELIGGIFLCIPRTQSLGFLLISLTFVAVIVTVRLGILCFQIILVSSVVQLTGYNQISSSDGHDLLRLFFFTLIMVEIISYLINFLSLIQQVKFNNSITKVVKIMNKYYGISLWRVFTSDITSIYIEVYAKKQFTNFQLISDWNKWNCFRYRNVGESITLTSIFTTLKYFPEDQNLFENKLFIHADSIKDFSYIKYKVFYISTNRNFSSPKFELISEFNVDKLKKKLSIDVMNHEIDLKKPDLYSAVRKNSGTGNSGF